MVGVSVEEFEGEISGLLDFGSVHFGSFVEFELIWRMVFRSGGISLRVGLRSGRIRVMLLILGLRGRVHWFMVDCFNWVWSQF